MSSGQFPIAVGFQPVPLFLHHSRLLRRKLRGTIETQAEVAIYQFPGWTPRPAGDRDSDFAGVDVP